MTLDELKQNRNSIKIRLDEIRNAYDKSNEQALIAICKSVELLMKLDDIIYSLEYPTRTKLGPGKPG